MKIGVLALQGDFAEHVSMLKRIGVEAAEVRLPKHLDDLNGLIIPGGESTTIGKLAVAYNLMDPLREFGKSHAIWGTCAGAILLARHIAEGRPAGQPALALQGVQTRRLEAAVNVTQQLTSIAAGILSVAMRRSVSPRRTS